MAKAKKDTGKGKEMTVLALFVKDTTNYHSYEAANGQGVYMSMGIDKEIDIPKTITLELVTKNDPRWKEAMLKKLEGAREGSKTYAKYAKALA